MSEQGYSSSGSWTQGWKLILGIFITFVVLSVVMGRSGPPSRASIASQLEDNRQIELTIAALKTHYPSDYEQLLDRLSAAAASGGLAAADRESAIFMRGFMTSKADSIANASDVELRRIAEADLETTRLLQQHDIGLCAAFTMDGLPPGSHPPDAVYAQLDRAASLRIRAARSGENVPPRARPRLSPDDARAWLARMDAMDPASAALIRAGGLERAAPAQQCPAGILIYRSALDLPAELSARVTANLIRDSVRPAR